MIVSIIFACKPFLFWVIELCELVSASGKWMPGGSLIANELQVVWLNFSILLNWSASRNSKQDHGMHWHASAPTVHAIRTRHASRLRKIVDRLSAEQRAPWDEDESCERTLLRWFSLSTNCFRQTMTNYHLQTSSWWVACCSFCGKQYLSRKQGRCDIAWALRHSTDPSVQTWQMTQAQPFNMLTCSTTPMLRRICWVGLVRAPPFARSAIQVTRAVLQTLWFSLRMQRSWMKVK